MRYGYETGICPNSCAATPARLTIYDWADPSTGSGKAARGGPVGQETFVNFIEIQPYLEEDEG